jgi:hypothetical protein
MNKAGLGVEKRNSLKEKKYERLRKQIPGIQKKHSLFVSFCFLNRVGFL